MDDKAINLISVMLKDIEEYKDIDPLDIYLNKSTFNKEGGIKHEKIRF